MSACVDSPLKLLIMTDTPILGPGGSERFLRNLLQRLAPERYTIDVLQLSEPPTEAQRVAQWNKPSVRLIYRPINAVYGLSGLAALRFVRRRVKDRCYDIVQSHHEKSDLINAFLPRIGGLRKISNRRDMGFQKSARLRALFSRINSRFDQIVAPTSHIIDALVADENVDSNRCRAIANGVDTLRFRPADDERRARLRADLGVGADAPLIGCVASFSLVKRHIDLIAAFAQLGEQYPDAHLLLVGEGPLRAELEAQNATLGLRARIHLLGARADVENILPALDIFALASSTEGMSNAILEAQACAIAVVATAVGGTLELVEPDRTGLLVRAHEPEEMAAAFAKLLADSASRTAMGKAARSHIENHHSLDAMASTYDNLYRELAHAH
jgi:glycosyltransferase involved in cell wall biosynthesis